MNVLFKRLSEHALPPLRATSGSAGYDLSVPHDLVVTIYGVNDPRGSNVVLCRTGWACEIPENFVGLICPRSGLALRENITVGNAPGIIDSDYRGEIGVILRNHSSDTVTLMGGTRVAQLLLMPIVLFDVKFVESLNDTQRGEGGFGSTGR